MTQQPNEKPNPSLEKKHAARMAAVQCLYQRSYLEPEPKAEALIARVMGMQEDDADEAIELPTQPDEKLLRGIVSGSGEQREVLEEKLRAALGQRWQGERLTTLMKAILRAATYELMYHPELKTAIILDEYVTITADFYGEQETRLLNGLLQEAARCVRQ